ncbi:hypothetical protein D7Z54_30265 [Salibacterium salarium]|uniref:YaaC-like Protein n=1 Tax=Salibacterium salarium TaxID=284579 RepID=A0A428MU22_9BACI|nr:YaaC family protein [Salibacterium salarium]RSL29629.1 hypothetical protein D7Z54_30265 [Salibacterium salarium]
MSLNQTAELFPYYDAYESQEVLHQHLYQHYLLRGASKQEALTWSYRNAPVFHYEWFIGRTYWNEAIHASMITKPLLLFYGLTHLLKGITLLEDPYYPATVEVLSHGVTTRKRKKKGYTFLDDEIKIQKKGFYPHFSKHLFHMKHSIGFKWKMKHLLMKWNSIFLLYLQINGDNALPCVQWTHSMIKIDNLPTTNHDKTQSIKKQLQELHINPMEVKQQTASSITFNIENCPENLEQFFLKKGDKLYFPPFPSSFSLLPTLSAHYLVLYNLSMISRYEGEWWGELMTQHVTSDYAFIKRYLSFSIHDVPALFQPFFIPAKSLQ